MSYVMNEPHLRPSCLNRIPTLPPTPATNVRLSSARARIRLRDGTMKTRLQLIGNKFTASNLRAWWVSIRCLLKRGESDCRMTISDGRERTKVAPAIALRPTVVLRQEKQGMSPTRIWGGRVLESRSGRHLWLLLRSEVHRRGALWETACFLAIWLSGLIAVAICVL